LSVIPALRRLKQEDLDFKAGLDYIVKPHLKKQNIERKRERERERERKKKERKKVKERKPICGTMCIILSFKY
jgi:hypothetical protein